MDGRDSNLCAYLRFATEQKGGAVIEGNGGGFGFKGPFPLRHPMVTGWFGETPQMDGAFWWWRTDGEGHELPAIEAAALAAPRGIARPIETPEQMAEHLALCERCYDNIPEGFGDVVFLPAKAILDPRLTAFGVWENDRLVSGCIAFTEGDVCGLYWAATDTEHRGRGYGSETLLACAEASGASSFVGQASRQGLPVWEKLGFSVTHRYVRTLVGG